MIPEYSYIESTVERPSPSRRRFGPVYLTVALVLAALSLRAFYLQVWQGGHYRKAAEGNRVMAVPVAAPRGMIRDATGQDLVDNVASTDVLVDPAQLPRQEEARREVFKRLASILGADESEVGAVFEEAMSSQKVTRTAVAISHEAAIEIEQNGRELPGVRTVSSLVRKYKFGQTAAHVLGYTGPVTAEEIAAGGGLRPNDMTGKSGLEKAYETRLHGIEGVKYIEINADGKIQKELNRSEPVPGDSLELTVDIELQEALMAIMEEAGGTEEVGGASKPSAVIVLDPRSGAVRAIASYPAHDPNIFSQPALRDQTVNLIKDERQPLFNRAVDGSYPPGSVIKPLLAAAALEENVISPQTTVVSSGGLQIGSWYFPDWKAGGHGITDVKKALAESVNTFFYVAIGGEGEKRGLGVDKTTKYLRMMGWGKATGIDLPHEEEGFLPSPEWKVAAKSEQWYVGDTYHLSIGQGDVLASPLQVAVSTAAVANGGKVHQPFLVRKIIPASGEPIEAATKSSETGISGQNLAVVRQGMRAAVTDGSARLLGDMAIELAGKTGTAQIGGMEDTHAWFTSFGPYSDPKVVVTVLVERGGDGDKVAVPVAKKVWQWLYENERID